MSAKVGSKVRTKNMINTAFEVERLVVSILQIERKYVKNNTIGNWEEGGHICHTGPRF